MRRLRKELLGVWVAKINAEAVDDKGFRQARVRSRAEGRRLRTIITNITIITIITIIAILTSLEKVRRNIYQIDYY